MVLPPTSDPWSSFPLDPRDPAHRDLRAADADRDVVAGWLTQAYSEGRIDRDELDERTDELHRTKTLGQLPTLVSDLMPRRAPSPIRGGDLVRAGPADLELRARSTVAEDFRQSVLSGVGLVAVLWVIWFFTDQQHDTPWPAIITVLAALRLAKRYADRSSRVEREVRRLEKKQRRQLKRPETPMGD